MALIKKLRKKKKEAPPNEKPDVVKTHLRDMIIVPEMTGSVVGVYNGKTFNRRDQAGDDWSLLGRVFHHVQACEARSSWNRRHPFVQVHPSQVEDILCLSSISPL